MMGGHPKRIDCDLLVVGGGINGAGIARDAAGRGLRVVLCEKDDLGQHTSSASSKLVHGGLRYLEQRQFALVRKALAEREVLLKSAPHIMRPLRFVMPHGATAPAGRDRAGGADGGAKGGGMGGAMGGEEGGEEGSEEGGGRRGQRPAWMIRAGLFLYDHLARRDFLPASGAIDLRADPAGAALRQGYARAFVYSDAWVDDARLVVLAAVDARERGATVLTRTRCTALRRDPSRWAATLAGPAGEVAVQARCLVNATGPWAARFLQDATGLRTPGVRQLRLVKGSHIVVPRLFEHDQAYLLQQPDSRIVFALPYEGAFTLVGTTDVEYTGDLDRVAISAAETDYLCRAANRCFERRIGPEDVVWSYAGVRPLVGDEGAASVSAASRDYRLDTDTGGAPLLSVYGGKITTFRRLAEDAVDWIAPTLGRRAPGWTAPGCAPASSNTPGWRRPCWNVMLAPTVPGWARCWRIAARAPTSAPKWCRGCSKWNWIICGARNGRWAPTTCCGVAPSWDCTWRRARRPGWMPG
jgi:glycerol-3-phosphate dehydrogenase